MLEDISPLQFRERCDQGELWRLLDVREHWEIEIAALAGTIAIPMAEVPARIDELDRSQPVAVLCHAGIRSGKVANFLVQQGFDRVANITGGIEAWSLTVDPSIPRY